MADPLTPAPLSREAIREIQSRPPHDGHLTTHPIRLTRAERDALCALALARQEPMPTCATCRHNLKCEIQQVAASVNEWDEQRAAEFACNAHEPKPAEVIP